MNEIRPLLALELRSLYGINKIIHTKDIKAKNRFKLLGVAWIFIIGMMWFYIGSLVYGLCLVGLSDIVPAYLTVLSSLLVLAFGIFSAGNKIFGYKGYDILVSMPIKPNSVILSRFFGLYIADLIFVLVIMLPVIAVYGYLINPDVLFYLFTVIGILFIPVIPLIISCIFGTVVLAITSRMKNKSLMQTLFMVLLVLAILIPSFSTDSSSGAISYEEFANIAEMLGDLIGGIYPPAIWFCSGVIKYDILSFLLFVILSLAAITLFVFIAAKGFNRIMGRLNSFSAKHNYKIGRMEKGGLLKALYLREVKRYFSSSIYVTNTIIGPILGGVMAVAVCFTGAENIASALPFKINVIAILPFAFSAICCMMTTTSCSISMEGKQFWVIKSLPIPTKNLLDSKILLNLSIMLPAYIVAEIAFFVAFKPNAMELLWQIIIPALIMLFTVVLGITVNLKFYSFSWEQEAAVVKQSLPAMLGGFAGPLLCIALIAVMAAIPESYADILRLVICLTLVVITVLLYKMNNRKNLLNLV